MSTQLKINFLDGTTMQIAKDQIVSSQPSCQTPSFREYLIRSKIYNEMGHPVESLSLYLANQETAIKEYNDEDLLFCLIKPVYKFKEPGYEYKIKGYNFTALLKINSMQIEVDEYHNKNLKA